MDGVKKRKYFQLFKLGLPSLTFIVVLATVLVSVLGPKIITGSVYNVSDLENKIDKVSAGDYLNYNINGYSNWKVLRKDAHNGTIEVVSETNVKDITFDYTNSASAQEILQEAADEYTDDRYAISARPVSEKELGIMAYNEDFWLSPISDYVIGSTKGDINLEKGSNGKVVVIPCIELRVSDSEYNEYKRYEMNSTEEEYIINHPMNGISEWIVVSRTNDEYYYGKYLYVIPKNPIEVEVSGVDDIIGEKIQTIFSSFIELEEVSKVNYLSMFANGTEEKYSKILTKGETEKIHVITSNCTFKHNDDYMWLADGMMYTYNSTDKEDEIIYRNPDYYRKEKLGFRPVVTIKYGQGKEGKNVDTQKLKVGDYVKYSAKGYNSWRVLSIDETDGTIEIISSGNVKNITLNGKSGYDEAIDLLQNEVNQYIVGEKAISARLADERDSKVLYELDLNSQNIGAYWTSIKKESVETEINTKKKYNVYMIGTYYNGFSASIESQLKVSYINLYIQDKEMEEEFMYTAGLRPIIKLKLTEAEKINPSDCKKCEKTINIYNKLIVKDQQLKNEEYNKRFYGNAEKDYTSSNDNNNYYNNNSYVNNTKNVTCKSDGCCKDNWILLTVIIVIGIIICILVSVLTINSTLILKNMKKQ